MRALVTGGAGFIGSTVTDRLIAHGYEVYVVDDLSSGKLENLEEARRQGSITFHRYDVASEAIGDVFDRVRPYIVIHFAAQPSVPASVADPVLDANTNVLGLLRVLDASVAAKVQKVVFSSSGGTIYGSQDALPVPETAVGRPESPYGITKRAAEDYLRFYRSEYGLDFTSLALANVYGPRQDPHGEAGVVAIFSTRLLAGTPLTIYGDGEQTRDYVYVGDVAAANMRATDLALSEARGLDGPAYNVGTGTGTSVNRLADHLEQIAGVHPGREYRGEREGELRHSTLAVDKFGERGWAPRTDLESGLRETFRFLAGSRAAHPGSV